MPPSILLVRGASLRLGSVTVVELPVAWLRAPDRKVGLLAPKLAWRAEDGLLVGPGFHFPWRDSLGRLSALDLYVSGYAKGGAELDARLSAPGSNTQLRLNHSTATSLRCVPSAHRAPPMPPQCRGMRM